MKRCRAGAQEEFENHLIGTLRTSLGESENPVVDLELVEEKVRHELLHPVPPRLFSPRRILHTYDSIRSSAHYG
jgi:hypothetical protein